MSEVHLDQVRTIEETSFRQPWPPLAFEGEINHPLGLPLVAVVEPSGAVAGYLVLWLVADEVQVQNLAVSPRVRRRGVGRRLLVAGLREAWRRGATKATLEVRPSNRAARRLYESLGFHLVGVRPCYYESEQEDALLLDCDLTSLFTSLPETT
ncbi:MAG: ribosomal protein S18-alanine N-acetyltransferase [Deltaproteobacteria bacterium]|nr:ribosomal protein S18-alanine N-acetyltransferase [Deltaproteobacteria bacterium]